MNSYYPIMDLALNLLLQVKICKSYFSRKVNFEYLWVSILAHRKFLNRISFIVRQMTDLWWLFWMPQQCQIHLKSWQMKLFLYLSLWFKLFISQCYGFSQVIAVIFWNRSLKQQFVVQVCYREHCLSDLDSHEDKFDLLEVPN